RLGDELSDQLLFEAKLLRLRGRDRAAQLAADLLEAVAVELPELLDRNLGVADFGEGRTAVAAENVADTPDPEGQDEKPDHGGHDAFAEPGGGGFAHTSEHGETGRRWRGRNLKPIRKAPHHRDRPDLRQLNALRPFARDHGLL